MNDDFQTKVQLQRMANDEVRIDQLIKAGKLQAKVNKLEKDRAELERQQYLHSLNEVALTIAQNQYQENVKQYQAALSTFNKQVEAMNTFWGDKGKNDVFQKLQRGETFVFRFALWGFGELDVAKIIREKVQLFNNAHGKSEDNNHMEFLPAKQINKTDSRIFQDVYMVTAKAEDAEKLRDDVRSLIKQVAQSAGVSTSTFAFNARPVKSIRANMVIELIGSPSMSYNRQPRVFRTFKRIRPFNQEVGSLNGIDINDPKQYVMSGFTGQSKVCDDVNLVCLQALAQSDLLNVQEPFRYTTESGEVKFETTSYLNLLQQTLITSYNKLNLQQSIIKMQNGIPFSGKIVLETQTAFWDLGGIFGTEEEVWKQRQLTDEEIEQHVGGADEERATLKRLAQTDILEKIRISYQIVMTDVVDPNSDSFDMVNELLNNLTSEISADRIHQLGAVELKLPYPNKQSAESSFKDLSLSDFDHGQGEAPVDQRKNLDFRRVPTQVQTTVSKLFAKDGATVESVTEDPIIQRILAKTDKSRQSEIKKYISLYQDIVTYPQRLEDFNKRVHEARVAEYIKRSNLHQGQLSYFSEELEKTINSKKN